MQALRPALDGMSLQPSDLHDLIPWSLEQITASDLSAITWPEDFCTIARGPITLEARAWHWQNVGEIRTVDIHSPKVAIVNLFVYPENARQMPVFAMEFVTFGPKAVVGVVDVKWVEPKPDSDAFASDMRLIHKQLTPLPYGQDAPKWYQECRSGSDFFLRPTNEEELSKSMQCHKLTWQSYAERVANRAKTPTKSPSEGLLAYKLHHRENSPGITFLNRTFGADWTNRFFHLYYG